MNKRSCFLLFACALALLRPAQAYPPAPHHTLFGMVRDQFGNPLRGSAEIVFESSAGVQISAKVKPGLHPGVNYELEIPMDAGMTADLYKPTAMRPLVAFKIKVRIGKAVYLPIEMSADFSRLGQPGQKTQLNLTLGEDSDGDGIPDDWERLLLAARGGGSIADIDPDADADGDHLSNLGEYLAGTYAFDDKNGFSLAIVRTQNGNPVLEFMAVRGRTYTVLGSSNLVDWSPAQFRTPGATVTAGSYYANDTRTIQVEVPATPGQGVIVFKLLVQ